MIKTGNEERLLFLHGARRCILVASFNRALYFLDEIRLFSISESVFVEAAWDLSALLFSVYLISQVFSIKCVVGF